MASQAKAPSPARIAQVRRDVHALVTRALALLDDADIDSLVAARLQAALDSMGPLDTP